MPRILSRPKIEVFLSMMLAALVMSAGCMGGEPAETDVFHGKDIDPPQPITPFTLSDENGSEFSIDAYEGRVVVVAFLFTRCPDICPIVSENLRFISVQLGDRYPSEVAIISVTVDPWTDNSSVLAEYREARNLSWPHLTGELEVIEPIWRDFDVGLTTYDSDNDSDGVVDGFDTCPNTPAGETVDADGCGVETQGGANETAGRTEGRHHPLDYWVDHTTGTVILDGQMRQRVWWGDMDWNAEMVLADIDILLAEQ